VPAAKRQNKVHRIYDINDVYAADGTPRDRFHYLSLSKHDDPNRPNANEDQSARDVFLIRLAEMYLIVAEAQYKLNNNAGAAEYLNKVRERAALPGKKASLVVAPEAITLDFILDERAREFAGEQMRWFDLKRTGKLVERVKKYNPDAAAHIQPYHVLRPIPQAQIDAVTNKNEFIQNQGY
jgi:starch-binding outer membrane protein, SusD/RagB family